MVRRCEVCAALDSSKPETGSARVKLKRILVDDRVVALCARHAEAALEAGVTTLDGLRRLFPETGGQRSLVARRSPLDRRVFPARPEGRRRSIGRRTGDTD
jgi:hypothetical protein